MPASRIAASIAAAAFMLFATPAGAADDEGAVPTNVPGKDAMLAALAQQHGATDRHLPAARENIDLVSKLEMSTPPALRTPETADIPVMPEQIADLAVYKNFAYLNSWSEPTCKRGGIFVVDISNPAKPRQVTFLPAAPNSRHGEGAHVITVNTRRGPMDVLAVNNEPLPPPCDQQAPHAGGFDLWNVTNPRAPKLLARSVGDKGPDDGSLVGDDPTHQSHSTFMWQNTDTDRAYVVFTDNTELHDLDVFEITDPANPRPVAEFNLQARFPQIPDQGAYDLWIYHHDVVVKKIDGVWTMLVSYWDGGYVTLNVNNPANPQYIGDTHYDDPDPLTGWDPPEGNAHQAEFSHDNRYILAADEDFNAHRFVTEIDGEQIDFGVGVPVVGAAVPPEMIPGPGDPLEGDTRYIGDGCDPATIPPPQAGETVAVAERGGVAPGGAACGFELKTTNAENAGYEAILIFNNVLGAAPRCEQTNLNMTFLASNPDMKVLFIPRAIGFLIIDAYDPDTYRCVRDDPTSTPAPAPNRAGVPVSFSFEFDGWGYTNLFERGPGKMRRVDSFAIEESLDERYAFGFGDLSVHEFATDPTEYVAYSSYYSGGMRVFTFGPGGLVQRGKFIDEGGNNFWGVEQFTHGNRRYFAGSDRDFGLYIFRYTGPGAPQPPACRDTVVEVPHRGSARVPLTCTDANGNRLTRSIVSGPSAGRLSGSAASGAVTYEHTGSSLGNDSFTFKAADGSLESGTARVTLRVVAREGGACFNPFTGTAGRDNLVGSPFGDDLRGGADNDDVQGLHGDDCLRGEGGRDDLRGDSGRDRVSGGAGKDRIFGESGNDRLFGNSGNDHVDGASGHDRGDGGSGKDVMDGGSNNDRFAGGAGDDRIRGGPGRDRLSGGSGDDRLEAGDARNRLSGGSGGDELVAVNDKVDRIRCGRGRDRVRADAIDRVSRDCETVRRTRTTRGR